MSAKLPDVHQFEIARSAYPSIGIQIAERPSSGHRILSFPFIGPLCLMGVNGFFQSTVVMSPPKPQVSGISIRVRCVCVYKRTPHVRSRV